MIITAWPSLNEHQSHRADMPGHTLQRIPRNLVCIKTGLCSLFWLVAQAIFNLANPWAAVEKAQGLKQVLGRGAAEEMLRRPERLLREFRMGEERVRHIVLGSPLAPKLATTPPAWARSVAFFAYSALCYLLAGMLATCFIFLRTLKFILLRSERAWVTMCKVYLWQEPENG